MPMFDSSLKSQVFEIEARMAKRVEEVYNSWGQYEHDGGPTPKEILDRLLIIYENAIETMKKEIIAPVEPPVRRVPHQQLIPNPTMMQSVDMVKRLNKGYIRFVYDTSPIRLKQFFEEQEVREDLNPPEAISTETTVEAGSDFTLPDNI